MKEIKTQWILPHYTIDLIDFNADLKALQLTGNDGLYDGFCFGTIYFDSTKEMNDSIQALNDGANPVIDGWEDGLGNTLYLECCI